MAEFKTMKKSLHSIEDRPNWGCQRVEKTTILNTVIIVLGRYSITNLTLQLLINVQFT